MLTFLRLHLRANSCVCFIIWYTIEAILLYFLEFFVFSNALYLLLNAQILEFATIPFLLVNIHLMEDFKIQDTKKNFNQAHFFRPIALQKKYTYVHQVCA